MRLPVRFSAHLIVCLILAGQAAMAHDPHDPIQAVAVSPNFTQDQTVFVAMGLLSLKMGIFPVLKSTDGGVQWSVVQGLGNRNTAIYQILFSPNYANDQTVYAVGTGGLWMSSNQGTSWNQYSKLVLANAALSPNFANDNTLFAVGTKQQIVMSTNRGVQLTGVPLPTGLTAGFSSIAISPNYDKDHTLLLGCAKDGIFRSTNSGSTWLPVTSGQTLPAITALVFSPNYMSDKTAFAATNGSGVLISTDGGNTWNPSISGLSDLHVSSLALSPAYPVDSTIWITTASAGVFQSSNSGGSWSPQATVSRTLSGLTSTHYQSIAPATSGSNARLYLGMFEGLWSSPNSAQSWTYIDTLPTRLIRHVNLSPNFAQDQTILANTYGGGNLWSTDGGATWGFRNTGMRLSYTDASLISPNYAVDGTAYSSDASGLQQTTNRAMNWQLLQGLGSNVSTYPRALAISPAFATDSTLLIGLSTTNSGPGTINGLYLSTNGGNTWQDTTLTGIAGGVISIAVSPGFATDRTAFAASPSSGLFKSLDGGMTWTMLTLPISSPACALVAVSPSYSSDQTVFAVPLSGGIYKSMDGGADWTLLPSTNSIRTLDLQISPDYANDQAFYAGTLEKGLLRFSNGGTSITVLPVPDELITAVAVSPNLPNDRTLFAAGYHGLWKSTDSGNSWATTAAPGRIEESRQVNSSYAPQNPPSITYTGKWMGVNPSNSSSTYAYMSTSESADTAVLNFTGDGVEWVTFTGPKQGMASINLDGANITTVNLQAATGPNAQQIVWKLQGLNCGVHTLTITALPPAAGLSIAIDAFDVWTTSCPSP